ncbi:MAG: glutamate-1-semialdehyde 2,1-aminomutase [Elusimicrobia bacterium]|nr:glutamate-1-semialdehyde 2,1-aminomutase [Elusimicrobiota bacterium]
MAGLASEKLFARAQKVLAGGVNSPVRAFRAVGGCPRFMRRGSGAYLFDADERRYIDYCLSWGPLILGHARTEIVEAVKASAAMGSTFGAPTEGEVLLAEKIQEAFPSMELVRLTSSGTEAVMSALRAARARAGRDLAVKFSGCYHGHVDSLLVQAGSGAMTLGAPDSAGVPESWAKTTITLPYNDLKAVEGAFARWGERIAAVIVEPVVGNMGVVSPRDGFLQGLRRITSRAKSVLIFDEVITGFRLCWGGAQTLLKIKPDLTCLGKIVGGGMPLAAYGGRRDIMELVAPLGPVYQAGTLSGNPVAVAAGLECLRILEEEKPYERLAQLTEYLAQGIARQADKAGVPLRIHSAGSMFTLFFCASPIHDYETAKRADAKAYARFFHKMLGQGVYLPPAQFEAAFVSYAHTAEDLDATIAAAGKAFA